MDTDSFVVHINTEDFYSDIKPDLDMWFDTSKIDNKLDRPIPKGINEGIIGMFKDELGGQIMKMFCILRLETYAYLLDDDNEIKKAKGT